MVRDDILRFFERYEGQYTTTQIAIRINGSHGRVHTILQELYEEGIIAREFITDDAIYNKTRIYCVWRLA